jgi:DNA-3-methyladenine glycosylase
MARPVAAPPIASGVCRLPAAACQPLEAEFFARETLAVARELVGTVLILDDCAARIVETEAYTTDAASHAVTRRHKAAIMRETFGHVYVYSIYGMHVCLNFTTERDGTGAVLIRSGEPLAGIGRMARRRGTRDERLLTSGPGRLCQAFGIDASYNAEPVGRRIRLLACAPKAPIVEGPRIGISRAAELPWRFFEEGNRFVSRR